MRRFAPMVRFLAPAGKKWRRFAEISGNIQITVVLSVFYLVLLPFWAIPYKVFSDRLALGDARRARWIQRVPGVDWLESMRKQG